MSLVKLTAHTLLYIDPDNITLSSADHNEIIHYPLSPHWPLEEIQHTLSRFGLPVVIAIHSDACIYLPLPLLFSHHSWRQPLAPFAEAVLKEHHPHHAQHTWLFAPFIRRWQKPITVIAYPESLIIALTQIPYLQNTTCYCLPAWAFLYQAVPSKLPQQYLYATIERQWITWVVMDEARPALIFQEKLTQISQASVDQSSMRFRVLHPHYATLPIVMVQTACAHHPNRPPEAPRRAYAALPIKSASCLQKPGHQEKRYGVAIGIAALINIVCLVTLLALTQHFHLSTSNQVNTPKPSALLEHFLTEEKPLLNLPLQRLITALKPPDEHVQLLQVNGQWDRRYLSVRAQADSTQAMFHYVDTLEKTHIPEFGSIELLSHQGELRTKRIIFTVHIHITT